MDPWSPLPIETARLRLRVVSPSDAEAMTAYRSVPEVCRYVPFEPMDLVTVVGRIAGRWSAPTPESLFLVVEELASTRVIGDLSFWTRDDEHRGGEIGWVIDPDRSGHGFATEAAHGLLHLAFDTLLLHRVVARIDARNHPSIRLAERLGMRQEAHLVRNEWFKGEWTDEVDFALLEDEWQAQHTSPPAWCAGPRRAPAGSGYGRPR